MSSASHTNHQVNRSVLLVTLLLSITLINLFYALPPKNEFQVILHNPTLDFQHRLRLKLGSPFYEYTRFLTSHVPSSSSIALPPDNPTWDLYGNVLYMQYFLYPRVITSIDKADYSLVIRNKTDNTLWPSEKLSSSSVTYLQTNPELGINKLK